MLAMVAPIVSLVGCSVLTIVDRRGSPRIAALDQALGLHDHRPISFGLVLIAKSLDRHQLGNASKRRFVIVRSVVVWLKRSRNQIAERVRFLGVTIEGIHSIFAGPGGEK
jgi:hypothetical protein